MNPIICKQEGEVFPYKHGPLDWPCHWRLLLVPRGRSMTGPSKGTYHRLELTSMLRKPPSSLFAEDSPHRILPERGKRIPHWCISWECMHLNP
jgi:hypothetical protein